MNSILVKNAVRQSQSFNYKKVQSFEQSQRPNFSMTALSRPTLAAAF